MIQKDLNFIFIDKSVFFPMEKVLAIGDLHLGYGDILKNSGFDFQENQVDRIIKDLENIFSEIKKKGHEIKKIVFLGDIKHHFGFDYNEKNSLNKLSEFLKNNFDEKNVIILKGNHDTFLYGKKAFNYHIEGELFFCHGEEKFIEMFDTKIKTIVMGHLHPSVTLSDKFNIKREKFKCFLFGKYLKREVIVLPSFFDNTIGKNVNDYSTDLESLDNFSIIPSKNLIDFEIYVVGDDGIYHFGKIKELK